MRPIKAREKKLLSVFIVALVLVGTIFTAEWIWKEQQALHSMLVQLKSEERESAVWLEEKEVWEERESWLEKKQPVISDAVTASELFDKIINSAKKFDLDVSQTTFIGRRALEFYEEAGARLVLKGSMKSMIEWLQDVQKTDAFFSFPKITIKVEGSGKEIKMKCNARLVRWYSLK